MAFDFPNSPATGDTFQGYTWDGEKWVQTFNAPNTSGVIAIKVFTASGTYTPSANMTTCVIECVGGGGGGGGASSVAGTGSQAGGGGGGGYSSLVASSATIGASQTVTIGTSGGAGAAAAGSGGNGSDTSVGSLCIGKGGSGGTGNAGNGAVSGGTGGVAGTGDYSISGQRGNAGLGFGVVTVFSVPSGTGGQSGKNFGGGGQCSVTTAGLAGQNYGGGGGGGNSFNGVASFVGGAGAPGLVVITEYGMTALSSSTIASGAVRFDLPQGLSTTQQAQGRSNIGAGIAPTTITNSLSADVLLNNTANYFDGPSVAQGTAGTWLASGTVVLLDTSTAGAFYAKLWDGTTVIASAFTNSSALNNVITVSLSGVISSPAANIKISVRDAASTSGKILFNTTGSSKDCTLTAVRIA